jgi:hypothetical protein
MNIARTTISLVLLAALGTTAQAQSGLTREQVKAELADAIRTGDILAPGDSGLKLNEEFPQRYANVRASHERQQQQASVATAASAVAH